MEKTRTKATRKTYKKDSTNSVTEFQIKPEHRKALAFTEPDGTENYCFEDVFNIPCERALDAMTIFEEMNMRCTREDLVAFTEAIDNVLSKNKIDIFEIKKMNMILKERLEFIVYPELIYKLASVYYFDKTENPYRYDFKYGAEKIARWKKQELNAFFLQLPIQKLIPSYNLSGIDLEHYSMIIEKINAQHSQSIGTHLSAELLRKGLFGIQNSTRNTAQTTA